LQLLQQAPGTAKGKMLKTVAPRQKINTQLMESFLSAPRQIKHVPSYLKKSPGNLTDILLWCSITLTAGVFYYFTVDVILKLIIVFICLFIFLEIPCWRGGQALRFSGIFAPEGGSFTFACSHTNLLWYIRNSSLSSASEGASVYTLQFNGVPIGESNRSRELNGDVTCGLYSY